MLKTQTIKINDHHYMVNDRLRIQINKKDNYVFISDRSLAKKSNDPANCCGYFNLKQLLSGTFDNINSLMTVDENFKSVIVRLVRTDLSAFA